MTKIEQQKGYSELAQKAVSTLIEKGTDRYGLVQSPIWVLNLDVNTLDCVKNFDGPIERIRSKRLSEGSTYYSSYVPMGFGHRAIRASQRPGGCSNLHVDQPMIRAAVLMDLLGGRNVFHPAIEAYVQYYLEHFTDSQTGLIEWGIHTSVNVYDCCISALDGHWHELMIILPIWPVLYDIAPQRMRAFLEQFWNWHVDPKTGVVGRHPQRGEGCSFAMAAGEMVLACAFGHTLEPSGPWLDRALLVARSHWQIRDRRTDLFPDRLPSINCGTEEQRFDLQTSDTSVSGLWASRVMMAGRLTGCEELVEMARKTLSAWARYGWDDKSAMPWAMLNTDGSAVDEPRTEEKGTYDRQAPKGHWDFWKNYYGGFEYPFQTLMSYAIGAQFSGDKELVQHAERLADCYRRQLPANNGKGTFAANYGQLISFFLHMESITQDASYRQTAVQIADEAVKHLWAGKIFRGFPGKDYYEAVDGVGYLVQALVELESDPQKLEQLRQENIFLWNI